MRRFLILFAAAAALTCAMACDPDFFRLYGAVYSRVVPVYERPENEGDYSTRYIVNRAKTRADKDLKERLRVSFYPEGGHLIEGTRCMVAFEARDEEGRR